MNLEVFKNLIVNVGLLVLFAYMLFRLRFAREFIVNDYKTVKDKILMGIIFGMVGIISTYTGVNVHGAIANSRVIGVVAGGILGGPLVGIIAGVIAGSHRYLIDIGGFTAVACAVSTVVEGIIGGMYASYIKRNHSFVPVFLVTMLAEILQMIIIVLLARPVLQALHLVEVIALPMILFNSFGVVVLLSIVNSVVIEQDHNAAKRIRLIMEIADECLPYMRQGLYDQEHLRLAAQIILKQRDILGVVITDHQRILMCSGMATQLIKNSENLPEIAVHTMSSKRQGLANEGRQQDAFHDVLKSYTAVSAPLTQGSKMIGTLILLVPKFKLSSEVDLGFVNGLARMFSTQLELSQVDIQTKLRQKAEFSALQSQINPHFLFNALSTISAFVREKPDQARELLLALSGYFRNTLQDGHPMISLYDELQHVQYYLTLEKARFEDKLLITIDIPSDMECMVPSFILQPLVENAVKHGAMRSNKIGIIHVSAWQTEKEETMISVRDNGPGIPADVVSSLNRGLSCGKSIGLFNVQKRLTSLYGEQHRLLIWNTAEGAEITVRIPKETQWV